jgi:ABC-type proline/glycine betaine transport system ATPase subunit
MITLGVGMIRIIDTINQVISFWNFHFLLFPQNSLVSNFLFSLDLQHIKENKKNCYFIMLLSKIYQ